MSRLTFPTCVALVAALAACSQAESSNDQPTPMTQAAASQCSEMPDHLVLESRYVLRNDGDGWDVIVENPTNCEIEITSIILSGCEGVRSPCGTTIRRAVRISPRQEKSVYYVRPNNNSTFSTNTRFQSVVRWRYVT